MIRRFTGLLLNFLLLVSFLTGCVAPPESDVLIASTTSLENTQLPVSTVEPESSPVSSPSVSTPISTLTLQAVGENQNERLTICIREPSVPLNSFADSSSANAILQALQDGPVDFVNFQYKPVILDTTTAWEAITKTVTVKEGDRYFNPEDGNIHFYEGPDIEMPHLKVLFHLNSSLVWSDNQPLTAYDSSYVYDLLGQLPIQLANGWQPSGEKKFLATMDYHAVDPFTVEWVGIPGLVSFQYPNFFLPPFAEHKEVDLNTDWSEVSWGAYQIQEWIPGRHILLVRNPNYFRIGEGLPKVDEVEFKFVEPPYERELINRISASDCHILSLSPGTFIAPTDWIAGIKENNNLSIVSVPQNTGLQLIFNLHPDNQNSAIANIQTRQAIAYCINKTELAEELNSVEAQSYIHPLDPSYLEVTEKYPYNPQEGSKIWNETSKTTEENTLRLVLRDTPRIHLIGEKITDELVACGFDIQTSYLSNDDYYQPWPDGVIFGSQYDMTVFPLGGTNEPACNGYMSNNIPSSSNPTGLNISAFQDSNFDTVCFNALTSIDFDERVSLHQNAQQLWADALPSIPLIWFMYTTGVDCHVKGYTIDPTGNELWNIEEISLDGVCTN